MRNIWFSSFDLYLSSFCYVGKRGTVLSDDTPPDEKQKYKRTAAHRFTWTAVRIYCICNVCASPAQRYGYQTMHVSWLGYPCGSSSSQSILQIRASVTLWTTAPPLQWRDRTGFSPVSILASSCDEEHSHLWSSTNTIACSARLGKPPRRFFLNFMNQMFLKKKFFFKTGLFYQ